MEEAEILVPVILEGVKWVKDKLGPSKKELKVRITDLESQVKALSYGNAVLLESVEQIILAIVEKLKSDGNYTINADTIIQIEDNHGTIITTNNTITGTENSWLNMFDDVDLEIQKSRLKRPSDEE